jgi:hypothetical protein
MPPCFAMGEAAGTAAGMALAEDRSPRALEVLALQARLRAQGACLGESEAV